MNPIFSKVNTNLPEYFENYFRVFFIKLQQQQKKPKQIDDFL